MGPLEYYNLRFSFQFAGFVPYDFNIFSDQDFLSSNVTDVLDLNISSSSGNILGNAQPSTFSQVTS